MLDLSNIESVMDLFRLKERYCQPLSKEEQKVHREMAVKRQVQEVDAFVKLTDVRGIIKEGVTGLHKQLNTCEEVAKKANTDCATFQSRIKAVDRKVSEVAQLRKQIDMIFKLLKEQELKLIECTAAQDEDREKNDTKFKEQEETNKDLSGEMKQIEDETGKLAENIVNCDEKIDRIVRQNATIMTEWDQNYEMKMTALRVQINTMPAMYQQGLDRIQAQDNKIQQAMKSTIEQAQRMLFNSENRLYTVERRIAELHGLEKKVKVMNDSVKQIKKMETAFQETQAFIERTLPAQIHLQLCEGLNVTAGHFLDDLKEFENRKMTEFVHYD